MYRKIFIIYFFLLSCANGFISYDPYNTIVNEKSWLLEKKHFADEIKNLTEQLNTLRSQLERAREMVQLTDTLYSIARDPSSILESMDSFTKATRQLDLVSQTEETQAMYDLAKSMDRIERSTDAFGRTIERSAIFGNNDRTRNVSLYGTHRILKRWQNQFEDITGFSKEQDEALKSEIDKTVEQMAQVDASDAQAQNKVRAMQQKILALQAERNLLQQRVSNEATKAHMAKLEIEELKKELSSRASLENISRAYNARNAYIEANNFANTQRVNDYTSEVPTTSKITIQ